MTPHPKLTRLTPHERTTQALMAVGGIRGLVDAVRTSRHNANSRRAYVGAFDALADAVALAEREAVTERDRVWRDALKGEIEPTELEYIAGKISAIGTNALGSAYTKPCANPRFAENEAEREAFRRGQEDMRGRACLAFFKNADPAAPPKWFDVVKHIEALPILDAPGEAKEVAT